MTVFIEWLIQLLDRSNIVSILTFIIGLIFAIYFYYKSLYRLVYDISRINNIHNNENENMFTTRILFYNSGRKTITKNEIQNLELNSSSEIDSIKILEGSEIINVTKIANSIKIEINNYMDSSMYFVLEIDHRDELVPNGRISETGNILNTEPKKWTIFNLCLFPLIITAMLYDLILLYIKKVYLSPNILIDLLILYILIYLSRYIHGLFFIPDKLSSKYLDTKNKFAKEFKNTF